MKRVALCVGINDYPGTQNDLSGCVNDATDWAGVLATRGYEVTTLLDASATKTNVVAHLLSEVSQLRYRDKFVFTFSGHGTWIPDNDGDEIDGRDEALCLYEVWNGGILTDDELHNIFDQAVYGTQITVLSDSCHSGTVARGLMDFAPQIEGTPKFLSPGLLPTVSVTLEQAAEAEEKIVKSAKSRTGPILISGCADPEFSYDTSFGGRPNGAFTRIAIDALTPDIKTFKNWYAKIRSTLPSQAHPQTPQLGATNYQTGRAPLA